MKTYSIKYTYKTIQGDMNNASDQEFDGFDHEVRINHKFHISTDNLDFPEETFSTDIEEPYFVLVFYSDGGTFGRTDGYVQIIPPREKEKAFEIAKSIDKQFRYHEEETDISKLIDQKKFYAYWTSYFASFENVKILKYDGSVFEI